MVAQGFGVEFQTAGMFDPRADCVLTRPESPAMHPGVCSRPVPSVFVTFADLARVLDGVSVLASDFVGLIFALDPLTFEDDSET